MAARGSMALGARRLLTSRSAVTCAAAAKAASVASASPSRQSKATLLPNSSCTRGAPASTVAAGSVTLASGSHATSTAAAASAAACGSSATTRATVSPTWRALSVAKTGLRAIAIGVPSWELRSHSTSLSPPPSRRQSAPVSTASTPGMARAFSVDIPAIRACAWGLRTKAACASPARRMSSTKRPRPVRNRSSSRRGCAVPTCAMPASPLLRRPERFRPERNRSQSRARVEPATRRGG